MPIAHKTDYAAEGLLRTLEQYKDKPKFMALLNSYLAEVQAVEDAAWAVYTSRLLQNSPTGDLLAKIGKIVAQTNLGLNDAGYLLLIKARIRVNFSDGRRQTMTDIASLVTGGLTILAHDYPPASFLIAPQGIVPISPYIIVTQFLGLAIGAGVRLSFVYQWQALANTLIFGSVNLPSFAAGPPVTGAGGTVTQTFASVNDPGFGAGPPTTGTGGMFAGVVVQ